MKLYTLFGMTLVLALAPAYAQTPRVKGALESGLNDERNAKAYYSAVILKFGSLRPFSNIVQAEMRHEGLLLELYTSYRLSPPPDKLKQQPGESDADFIKRMRVPDTFAEAAKAAYQAEVANVALYDKINVSSLPDDVNAVFDRLRADSLERHMPAFKRHF